MAALTTDGLSARPPFWRSLKFIRWSIQLVAVGLSVAIVFYLWNNLIRNMRASGISTDFSFLTQALGVNIAGSDISPGAPIWRGLLVGIKNTFALVIVGVPLLTVLGVLIGIGKLSTNWLVAKICAVYVELFRNLPPLLLVYFMFNAVILQFPAVENSWDLGFVLINQRFVAFVGFVGQPGIGMYWLVMGVTLLIAIWVWIWRTRRWEQTGEPHRRVAWSMALLGAVALLAFLILGGPIALSIPAIDGRVATGGYQGLAQYFGVLIALSMYTASHVAEITRGSILAVAKGQTEAANALALKPTQRLRHIVLPQAMRIAIPPVISQYLNFTKNTSLALAIGYAEITRITFQTIGNGHPAPQMIALLMASYLVFSLTISVLVNILNRRLQYASR